MYTETMTTLKMKKKKKKDKVNLIYTKCNNNNKEIGKIMTWEKKNVVVFFTLF